MMTSTIMPTQSTEHQNLWIFEHPVIQDKLTRIRNIHTEHSEFRRLLNEISGLMFFQLSRSYQTKKVDVETPMEQTSGVQLANPITLVPILRAGVGMIDGILAMIPEARVGHIGVYRDEETKQPVPYYCKLPTDIASGPVLLIDPMLASGGSASYAAEVLRDEGFIRGYADEADGPREYLNVSIMYDSERKAVLNGIRRVSRPGLRVYVGQREIPRVYGGLGIAIMSTSQGVMSGREAWRRKIGGEVFGYVW